LVKSSESFKFRHQQLYITGKRIILKSYWVVGRDNSRGGTLRRGKCLTADKKLSLTLASLARTKQNFDGFVKSPSAVLRFILALLNSRYARRRSRFNRVNHCGAPISAPHSNRFARLASGAFYCAVSLRSYYETMKLSEGIFCKFGKEMIWR
jgi:hypothetical protein